MSELLGMLAAGGNIKKGLSESTAALFIYDGRVNPFGALGELGPEGFGLGRDRENCPIIPDFYEVPKKEILYSKKRWGQPGQYGVWGLGWGTPGKPDGVVYAKGPFGTRPGE